MKIEDFKKSLASLKKFSSLKENKTKVDLIKISNDCIATGNNSLQIKIDLKSNISSSFFIKYDIFEKVIKLVDPKEDINIYQKDSNFYINNIKIKESESETETYIMENIKEENFIKVFHENLENKLKLVHQSIDENNPKFELNGALFDITNNLLVSTDTRRLSTLKVNIESNIDENIIVPKTIVNCISNIKNIKDFTIFKDNNICKIVSEFISYYFEEIEGVYPNYERIIPSKLSNNIVKLDFKIPFKNELIFDIKEDKIEIIDKKDEISISVDNNSNIKGLKIAFNQKYIDAILKNSNDLTFYFTEHNLPISIMNNDSDLFIIMPIVIDNNDSKAIQKEDKIDSKKEHDFESFKQIQENNKIKQDKKDFEIKKDNLERRIKNQKQYEFDEKLEIKKLYIKKIEEIVVDGLELVAKKDFNFSCNFVLTKSGNNSKKKFSIKKDEIFTFSKIRDLNTKFYVFENKGYRFHFTTYELLDFFEFKFDFNDDIKAKRDSFNQEKEKEIVRLEKELKELLGETTEEVVSSSNTNLKEEKNMKYDIWIKGKISEIKNILPKKATYKIEQIKDDVSIQFNEEEKDIILESLYKNNIETINKDNIHRYYKFMNNEDLIKYESIVNIKLNSRIYLVEKELNIDFSSYDEDIDFSNRMLFIFEVKDTLKPIEEYIAEIKDSAMYKEYKCCELKNDSSSKQDEEEMHLIKTETLEDILKTDYEVVYILKDGTVNYTNDIDFDYSSLPVLWVFYTSDFETIFDIQRVIKDRKNKKDAA